MKPIVKWAGGKTQLLGELLSRVPERIPTYVEPFAGGAALFFALADGKRRFERAVIADENPDLVACYRAVKADVGAVIAILETYRYDKDLYYEVRARDTAAMTDTERGARLIFLNRTCFNGLWRVNSSGQNNVPFGRYTNPRIVDEEALVAAAGALAHAEIVGGDFTVATKHARAGDFVYYDPPYVPLTKTASFTSYAKGGFSRADHDRLLEDMRAIRARGGLAMLSNADTPDMRELYAGFAVHVLSARRNINRDVDKRGATSELLVTTWGAPAIHDAQTAE